VSDQGVHDPATKGEAVNASALDAPPADAQVADPAATTVPAVESEPIAVTAVGEEDATATGEADVPEENAKDWYILKVQVNREDSIRDALIRRMKILGLEQYFGEIVVPTEDVAEFNKSGKRRIVKRKLYPGYMLVNMTINDETWFLIRETPGVGDFTGSAGRPTPMEARDVERILRLGATEDEGGSQVKTAIPFTSGDRVRVKDGYFQNFEGEVAAIDHASGRVTVMINIFGRSTPVELEHWQVESV
jgi:transcriptional antiterminator NusG